MKRIIGKKIKEISNEELIHMINKYKSVVLDIGTGQGEFIYKEGKKNLDTMYIGIDISADSMEEYSRKASKKAEKGGLENVIYILSDVENFTQGLCSVVDNIYINLPWGTLRDGVVKGESNILDGIRKVAKNEGVLTIYTTYCDLYESKEIQYRELPKLDIHYLSQVLGKKYKDKGIIMTDLSSLDNEDLKNVPTKWARKLAFGRKREIFYMKFIIKK